MFICYEIVLDVRRHLGFCFGRTPGGAGWVAALLAFAIVQIRPLAIPRAERREAGCAGWDVAWICVGGRAPVQKCEPVKVIVRPLLCPECPAAVFSAPESAKAWGSPTINFDDLLYGLLWCFSLCLEGCC